MTFFTPLARAACQLLVYLSDGKTRDGVVCQRRSSLDVTLEHRGFPFGVMCVASARPVLALYTDLIGVDGRDS